MVPPFVHSNCSKVHSSLDHFFNCRKLVTRRRLSCVGQSSAIKRAGYGLSHPATLPACSHTQHERRQNERETTNSLSNGIVLGLRGNSRILPKLFEEQSCPANLELQISSREGSNKAFIRPHGLERAEGHAGVDAHNESALPAHAWWIAVSLPCQGSASLARP